MQFKNNFIAPVTLAQGADTLALALPDGEYRLTLTDEEQTRWEIVSAQLTGGDATLTRGQEGTADQLWPVGSRIYCSVTAGQMQQLFDAVQSLAARITALEAGPTESALTDASNQPLTDGSGNTLTES